MRLGNWAKWHARPASKDAKYYTHCLNCDEMLVRLPDSGPASSSSLQHLIVENGEVVGWRSHCDEAKVSR